MRGHSKEMKRFNYYSLVATKNKQDGFLLPRHSFYKSLRWLVTTEGEAKSQDLSHTSQVTSAKSHGSSCTVHVTILLPWRRLITLDSIAKFSTFATAFACRVVWR